MNVVAGIKRIRDDGKREVLEKLVEEISNSSNRQLKLQNILSKIMPLRNKLVRFEKTHSYQRLKELNRRFLWEK